MSILVPVLWERITTSMRRSDMTQRVMRAWVAGVSAVVLTCAGCGAAEKGIGARIPDVSGQQAHVALMHLRQTGYAHFSWAGRTSSRPVGTVLATPLPALQ